MSVWCLSQGRAALNIARGCINESSKSNISEV